MEITNNKKSEYSVSEVMQFFSLGFNTTEIYNYWEQKLDVEYYFYGYEDYSEAFINRLIMQLSTDKPNVFYPNFSFDHPSPRVYTRYDGENNNIGYNFNGINNWNFNEEHKFENNVLVFYGTFAQTVSGNYRPYYNEAKIVQNEQEINIYHTIFGDETSWRIRKYCNISRTELLDIFLKNYVVLICQINDMVNDDNNNSDEYLLSLIKGRTLRELSIFRNCLYAIKGYKFKDSNWTEFFNKYLKDYEAKYSENIVISMFTENEKWLLYLIIRYENRK